jgi:hypothetical protein
LYIGGIKITGREHQLHVLNKYEEISFLLALNYDDKFIESPFRHVINTSDIVRTTILAFI